jgi:archaellum biogenesis ATPase FlaH
MSNTSMPEKQILFAFTRLDSHSPKEQNDALMAEFSIPVEQAEQCRMVAQARARKHHEREQADPEKQPTFNPQPVAFDFDEEEPEPNWVIEGVVERKEVCLLSGDTGAAKSIMTALLISQSLHEDEWLGFGTNIERVICVDEENTSGRVKRRLRSLGMTNDQSHRLRYFSRAGASIGGGGPTDTWLENQLGEFQPDLLVIDTLLAATAVAETNSNDQAAALMSVFRGMAERYNCAILLLHHERKQSKDLPSSSSQATLGARAWVGQSDAHITLTVDSEYEENDQALDDENIGTRKTFKLRTGEKVRDGGLNHPQRLVLTSEKTPRGKTVWMLVDNEGPIEKPQTKESSLAQVIASAVRLNEGEMTTGEIAKQIGQDAQGIDFKRGLSNAVSLGLLEKPKRGTYVLGSLGLLDV